MTSGAPNDKAVNVWHFLADDENELFTAAYVQVTTFYSAIDGLLSSAVASTGHRARAYDLADTMPRAPVFDDDPGPLTVGVNALPSELACCVSYQAPRQSGLSQARRRGRLYIGPLSAAWVNTDGTMNATALSTLGTAVQNFLDASQAATTWSWQVYSPTNLASIEVTNAWIDNAWDVQRRRGVEATSRALFV